jgi:hypothetical protein
MADLITLDEAIAHLRLPEDYGGDTQSRQDLQDKVLAATQVVIDYLTRRETEWNATMDAWTTDTVPASVKAAVLVQLGHLYRQRGDDDIPPETTGPGASLSPTVMSLLMRYRDPGMA